MPCMQVQGEPAAAVPAGLGSLDWTTPQLLIVSLAYEAAVACSYCCFVVE